MSPLFDDDTTLILEHRPSARRRLKNAAFHARNAQRELERAMRQVDANGNRTDIQAVAETAALVRLDANKIAERL